MRWVFKNTSASSQPWLPPVYGVGCHTRQIGLFSSRPQRRTVQKIFKPPKSAKVRLGGGIATSLLKDNGSSSASPATESERNLSDKELVFLWSTYFFEEYFSLSEEYICAFHVNGLATRHPCLTDPVSEKARAMQANRDCVLPLSPKPEVKLRRLDLSLSARDLDETRKSKRRLGLTKYWPAKNRDTS